MLANDIAAIATPTHARAVATCDIPLTAPSKLILSKFNDCMKSANSLINTIASAAINATIGIITMITAEIANNGTINPVNVAARPVAPASAAAPPAAAASISGPAAATALPAAPRPLTPSAISSAPDTVLLTSPISSAPLNKPLNQSPIFWKLVFGV